MEQILSRIVFHATSKGIIMSEKCGLLFFLQIYMLHTAAWAFNKGLKVENKNEDSTPYASNADQTTRFRSKYFTHPTHFSLQHTTSFWIMHISEILSQ